MPVRYKEIKQWWDEKMNQPFNEDEMLMIRILLEHVDFEIEKQYNDTEVIKIFLPYFNFTTNPSDNKQYNGIEPRRKDKLINYVKDLYIEAGWSVEYKTHYDTDHESFVVLRPLKND
jgi:hypothetical protein